MQPAPVDANKSGGRGPSQPPPAEMTASSRHRRRPEQGECGRACHTGSSTITGTEVGDEDGYYEVEVTLADGRQVDVHLDRSFNVLITKADQEHPTTAAPDRALIAKQRAGETEAFGQPASR